MAKNCRELARWSSTDSPTLILSKIPPFAPRLDTINSLAIINCYYNDQENPSTQTLIDGAISSEEKVGIEWNRERMRERHDEAVRRLRRRELGEGDI